MVRLKSFKMYAFGKSHIKEQIIQSVDLNNNEITITESFLTRALECYKQL